MKPGERTYLDEEHSCPETARARTWSRLAARSRQVLSDEEAIKCKESNRVKGGLQEGSKKKRSEDGTVDLTSKLEVSDKRQGQ